MYRRSFLSMAYGFLASSRISAISSADLEELIAGAARRHRTGVRIPSGAYRIVPPSGQSCHLRLSGLANFEVDARDVKFIFTEVTRGGVEIVDCQRLRIHGLTVLYETPPFTQGRIEGVSNDGDSFDVRVATGYPTNLDDGRYFPARPTAHVFESNGSLKPSISDVYARATKKLDPTLFRVCGRSTVVPGDLVAIRGTGQHNFSIIRSSETELRNVTILSAGMFAIWEGHGEGGNRYSVQVKKGPAPPGAKIEPLYSSAADGFHSTNMRQGPILEDCYFEATGDDAIAIQGTYSLVLASRQQTLIINNNTFRPGDPLLLFGPEATPVDEAVVTAVTQNPTFSTTRKSGRPSKKDNTKGPYFSITLDRPVKAEFDYLCSNPSALGSGYTLRRNTIRGHRARGMLLKAHNGMIEGNVIDGSSMAGIMLAPEPWWNEACYSHHVTIRNNVVRNVAYYPLTLGAVIVAAIGEVPIAGCGHKNIVIEKNRIENVDCVNLLMTSVQGAVIKNNHFVNAQHRRVPTGGAQWGESEDSLVFVSETSNLKVLGNSVKNLGNANRCLLETTPSVKDIQSDWPRGR